MLVAAATQRVLWQGRSGTDVYTVIEWQYDGQTSWECFVAQGGRPTSLGRHGDIVDCLLQLGQHRIGNGNA
ncbi:hypothetical protein K3U93_18535 [Mycobacterium malmoense]|uniref:DUF1508 domain-containing protein n=1 Tax=Mycobacterium malmoense TaxID=1780 RepID=A0ABX3ST69_MYCMA|nr:hypothetical protein [Mycobacterium malmoense]OIN82679.1 hypothetical protein BMG05_01065 [Mycobacterium malmoense]ORA82089.1 hypothetical protein BST29_12925 [Mycobacterium malmoense]QZA16632.1 hypothetical protein K3U93_18535 [Mycobacterium malmoense]UNB93432.1 hypothetical protein H5T25_18520 [Mycobacterium malmoense]